MKHGAKRLISLLTVLVMVCSHAAVSVSAADAVTVTVPDSVAYGGETGTPDISGMGDNDDIVQYDGVDGTAFGASGDETFNITEVPDPVENTLTEDTPPEDVVTVTAPGNITYGEALGEPVISGMDDSDVIFQYEGVDGTVYGPSEEKPTEAGSYRVTAVEKEGPGRWNSETFTITAVPDTGENAPVEDTPREDAPDEDTPPEDAVTVTAPDNITYGEVLGEPVISGMDDSDVSFWYEGVDGTVYGPSEEKPTEAGSYRVTAVEKEGLGRWNSETFTITEASDPVEDTLTEKTSAKDAAYVRVPSRDAVDALPTVTLTSGKEQYKYIFANNPNNSMENMTNCAGEIKGKLNGNEVTLIPKEWQRNPLGLLNGFHGSVQSHYGYNTFYATEFTVKDTGEEVKTAPYDAARAQLHVCVIAVNANLRCDGYTDGQISVTKSAALAVEDKEGLAALLQQLPTKAEVRYEPEQVTTG